MSEVHPAAAAGFERGIDTYVRGRPEFPPAAVGWLRDDLALRAGKTAIELGAGTGKFLGLIWNVRDDSVEWVRKLTDIMAPHEGDAPRYYHGEWRRVFPAPGFGPLEQRAFPHEHVGPSERVIVDRVASVSFIAALDETARMSVLEQVRALIGSTASLAGRTVVQVPYQTRSYWCARL
jgi:hypothetical protein